MTLIATTYEVHPAATLFPLMTDDEFQGLKHDMASFGQREPIIVWCNQIIDGRNRLKACEELGRTPEFAELDEDRDPWAYVISHNLHRRHLTTSQRAAVAAKMATLKRGDVKTQKDGGQNCLPTEDAAKALKVSPRSVKSARKVQELGSVEVNKAVEQGQLPVSVAAELVVSVPDKAEQTAIVAKGVKAVRSSAKKPKAIENPIDDKFDEPWLNAFAHVDYRMNTLKRLICGLAPHEKIVVKEWLTGSTETRGND
jgi:hypothetical protein